MNKVLKHIFIGIIIVIGAAYLTFVLRQNFFKFDKALSKDNKDLLEEYISDIKNSYLEEGMTFLSTYYFGNRYNDEKLNVYLWVMFDEYVVNTTEFEFYKGTNEAYKLVINMSDDKFEIIEHELISNDNYDEVPLALRKKVKNYSESREYNKLLDEHKDMIETHKEYFKGEK